MCYSYLSNIGHYYYLRSRIYLHFLSFQPGLLFLFHDSYCQEEGEKQLVLLKQRAADVVVDAEGEMINDVLNS